MNQPIEQNDEDVIPTTEQVIAGSRRRKKAEMQPSAEIVQKKIQMRLLRPAYIDGSIVEPGNIVEVDEATCKELLKPFPVQTSFEGYRKRYEKEFIVRAERIN